MPIEHRHLEPNIADRRVDLKEELIHRLDVTVRM